jgi:hypothetical protein
VRITGTGEPTSYLPMTLWLLGGLAVAAAALVVLEVRRPRPPVHGLTPDQLEAVEHAHRVHASRVTVTTTVLGEPTPLTARPAAPALGDVLDAEVVEPVEQRREGAR